MRYMYCLLVLISMWQCFLAKTYEPTWESLDSRPLPSWYDEGKIGIFIHWGVFAVPSFHSEWFWWAWKGAPSPDVVEFMQKNYKPGFTYADFAKEFTAEFYDASKWAQIFRSAGAKYVVLVSKHHEGFTNWPSKYSFQWNSMAVGPKRDLVGELAAAIKKTDMHFGVYHSLFEWFNPLMEKDRENNFTTQQFVDSKTMPELYELVNNYKPDVVWSDGDWVGNDTYWKSKEFLAWLYNDSPVKDTVVTNDRWGNGDSCKHGGFWTCHDKYNPGVVQEHKWENCMTIDKGSWGYRRNADIEAYLTPEELIWTVVETVSCGGNILINVGPTKDGIISPVFEERLYQLGTWLSVNGDAIYGTKPWKFQNDTVTKNIWYTSKETFDGKSVYAMTRQWPDDDLYLAAPQPSDTTIVNLLGYGPVTYKKSPTGGITIAVPAITINNIPCLYAWTFEITGLDNQ